MDDLKIINTTLEIGIEKPFKLLHITDTHITFDDDGNQHQRQSCFNNDYENCCIHYFMQVLNYAKENSLTVLNTGDFLDFLSEGNFRFADKYLSQLDCIYAAGNHDFCHCVGKAKEDYEYKWEMISKSAPHLPNNLYFYSRVINGVNIVTLDNSYYLITEGQLELLKAEVARGLPIILGVHVPFYTPKLAALLGTPAYVVAAPKELLATYSESRRAQQTPDAATLKAVEYIHSEPLIKAIVAGHTHCNFEDTLRSGKPQIVTHGTFAGFVREITIT